MSEKSVTIEKVLGPELFALIKDNAGILQDLNDLAMNNSAAVSPVDLALLLFTVVGSTGPSNPPFFEQKISGEWKGKVLILSVQNEYKGQYVGEGCQHFMSVDKILNRFGYYLALA